VNLAAHAASAVGLLLAPYRLERRGSRKRKRESRMHQETLRAIRESGGKSSGN